MADQDRQPSAVSSSRLAISSWSQVRRAGCHVGPCWSENPTDSPARSLNRPVAVAPSTVSSTAADSSSSRSAPPRAARPPSTGVRIGWMSPYSGRGAYSTSTSTWPSVQLRRRSSTPGEPAPSSWPRSLRPTASASTSTTTPVGVRKVVARAIVWSR
jgi:hypothetical protein